jgi:amino acid adenylation domain-containing protein
MTLAAEVASLAALLENWARRTPGAVAAEDSAGRALAYAGLDALASRIAQRLVERGVAPGDRVGVCLPKSLASFASLLAISKARAAYVPVDFSAPAERNRFIFADCGARVVITDEARAAALAAGDDFAAPLLAFAGDASQGEDAAWLEGASAGFRAGSAASREDLAYILYTSGSTGKPKGVVHTNASALSFVDWAAKLIAPASDDRFSSHAPFHFDLSILDLYAPLTAGARVVLVSEALGKDPHALARFIAERRISVWYSVPSILAVLAQHGKLAQHDYAELRLVLFAGEVFPVKHLRALKKLWTKPAYYNLYGPTETNVCTYFRIPDAIEEARATPFPIGPACENCEALALDDAMQPVPAGSEGMLYVRASGPVMRGYWNLPERDAQAFRETADGRRWYATGDVVVADAAGCFSYVGRRDRMVKRRGYRIELGEIEAVLYRHPAIREAAVVAKSQEDGVAIWAYVTPSAAGAAPSIIELKQFCAKQLLSYMSPDRFVVLERLPRTSTDKVDYQALLKSA